MLDPFTVTAETGGYQAVDTLGGARVQTRLVDTPSAISVVTKALLNDAGLNNAQDLLVYTTNTEVAGLNGNFSGVAARGSGVSSNAEAGRLLNPSTANRSRGISPMDNTRNYFQSQIPWDSFNISRIDISRGPNSFLFGVGSPSGISNYTTNEALFRDEGSFEVKVASYGTTREALDYNKVLIPKELAFRIDLLNDDTKFRQKPAYNHSQRAYAALRYDPKALNTDNSHLKIQANAEAGRVRSNNPRELPPMDFLTGFFAGGLDKSGYDPFLYPTGAQLTGVGSFVGNTAPYAAIANHYVNAQDYHYLWPGPNAAFVYDTDNTSSKYGSLLSSFTTLNGPKDKNGVNGMSSFPQAAPMYISGFTNYAATMNYLDPTKYPGAYAQTVSYNNKSITDTSIFNFYDKLIDGPNKEEWQNWKTYNVSVVETLFDNRFAIQGIIDHQEFDLGQFGIFGYVEPFISVDMDKYLIAYPSWLTDGSGNALAVRNPNEGRPFVASDFGGGNNSTRYVYDNYQVTMNGDLRAEDFMQKGLASKIIGHHSLTLLGGKYKTYTENRTWAGYATDVAFGQAMGDAAGGITANRGIDWVAYLGPSLSSASSASGLNLNNVATVVAPQSGTIQNFSSTWTASSTVDPAAVWHDPNPNLTDTSANNSTQLQNPLNYKGWTTMPVNVLNWRDNLDQLTLSGNKNLQELRSAAFMYQGHIFDDMIIPEYGWRRDRQTMRNTNQPLDNNTHVGIPGYQITGDEVVNTVSSTSYGLTLHLPKSIRGKLPLDSDVSLYYFHGNNQTPKIRYAFDTSQIPSEAGKTDDFGVQVDTLNGRATIRLTFFKTKDLNAAAGSGAADPLGNNGYYMYLLPAWGAGDAAANGLGLAGLDGSGFSNNTGDAAEHARQAAAVAAWKSTIANYFPQSFFDAYGLGVNVAALQAGNFANVYNNPNAFPYPWVIANTGGGKINGQFPIISQDIQSKGFELEVNVRPLEHWDVMFNANKVDATQTALGTADSAFIEKEYEFFKGPAGTLPLWGYWGGAGGGTSTLYSYFMSNIWSAYQLQAAQTGSTQPELQRWSFKAITNYSFTTGRLKGINVGGGFRWSDKPILGYGISAFTDPTGASGWIMDVKKPLYGDTEEHVDLWVGYEHKLTPKINWKIQLNVKNVGERPKLIPVSLEPNDGSMAQGRISLGQILELTNRFSF